MRFLSAKPRDAEPDVVRFETYWVVGVVTTNPGIVTANPNFIVRRDFASRQEADEFAARFLERSSGWITYDVREGTHHVRVDQVVAVHVTAHSRTVRATNSEINDRVRVRVADLAALASFIDEYAWHTRDCAAIDVDGEWHTGNPPCTCGYDEALAAVAIRMEHGPLM